MSDDLDIHAFRVTRTRIASAIRPADSQPSFACTSKATTRIAALPRCTILITTASHFRIWIIYAFVPRYASRSEATVSNLWNRAVIALGFREPTGEGDIVRIAVSVICITGTVSVSIHALTVGYATRLLSGATGGSNLHFSHFAA